MKMRSLLFTAASIALTAAALPGAADAAPLVAGYYTITFPGYCNSFVLFYDGVSQVSGTNTGCGGPVWMEGFSVTVGKTDVEPTTGKMWQVSDAELGAGTITTWNFYFTSNKKNQNWAVYDNVTTSGGGGMYLANDQAGSGIAITYTYSATAPADVAFGREGKSLNPR